MNRSREDWRVREGPRWSGPGSDTPHHRSLDERLKGARAYGGAGWHGETAAELQEFFDDDELEDRRAARRRRMESIKRSMRGLGPRPVPSEDERVRNKICRRMSDDEDLDASGIQVAVYDGDVTLDGMVEDEDDRRHAERCAASVRGVLRVHNRLRTRDDAWRRRSPWR